MDVLLLKLTALLYLLATGSFIFYVFFIREPVAKLSLAILAAGFLLHSASIGVHLFQTGYPNITQYREALTYYSWLMVAGFLVVQLKYRLTILGSIIAPLASIMTLAAFAFGAGPEELPAGLKSYWLAIHVSLAFLGNAAFALAFGVSVIYLLQERHLKHKKMTTLMKRFPSLESLDRLNYVLLVWGFPFMTLGIVTGTVWASIHWGDYWSWDPRLISSGLVWLFYGALLHGRITAGLRGRKAAVLTVFGFCIVLGYFLSGGLIFPSRHGGSFE